MRKDTGDDNYYAPIEKVKMTFSKRLETILFRPVKMFCTEPMLFAITIYMSFVYGTVYLLFEAYPIVFSQGHGMNPGLTGTRSSLLSLNYSTYAIIRCNVHSNYGGRSYCCNNLCFVLE